MDKALEKMTCKLDKETYDTPPVLRNQIKKVEIPPSPYMKQLGYGTGVNVYLLQRFSPVKGCYKSPWAVKKINSKLPPNSEFKERLEKEVKILKSLDHPNIIGYRSHTNSEDGNLCLIMESGEFSLADLIEIRSDEGLGPFPPEKILKVAASLASALNYLHSECHLLHGDLKSANVLIKGDFETVKLCDFGVTLTLDEKFTADTEPDSYIGSECWSAPEVIKGEKICDKTDIFSYGLTLWEMLSLCAPHLDKLNDDSLLNNSNLDAETLELLQLEQEVLFRKALGTRPSLPDVTLNDTYKKVLELFIVCTEADQEKRPSAKQILSVFFSVQ